MTVVRGVLGWHPPMAGYQGWEPRFAVVVRGRLVRAHEIRSASPDRAEQLERQPGPDRGASVFRDEAEAREFARWHSATFPSVNERDRARVEGRV